MLAPIVLRNHLGCPEGVEESAQRHGENQEDADHGGALDPAPGRIAELAHDHAQHHDERQNHEGLIGDGVEEEDGAQRVKQPGEETRGKGQEDGAGAPVTLGDPDANQEQDRQRSAPPNQRVAEACDGRGALIYGTAAVAIFKILDVERGGAAHDEQDQA